VAGRAQPGGRGDVDDRAAAALPHRGQDELGGEHDRAQVQVEGLLPLRRIRRREARLLDAPGVVDQHPDRTGRVDGRMDAGPVSEVGAEERAADPFGRNRALPVVEVGDDHAHALGGEPLRDPGAYPVRTSRHQCGHSAEFHGGIVGPGTDIPIRSQLGVRLASSPA
jgi:hypothetical protein